ncbi:MAG TPA: 2-dehydropantoate 2-reductase [Xanthobacteraceae bacterium]|nr:2-dehydropantoate 2-reductase [Xanthobacteraceae bacterium]
MDFASADDGAAAHPARLSVAIVGLGSIGGVAAGCLCDADRHDIVACARRPLDHLTLERIDGTVRLPLRTLTNPDNAEPVDWVLLCTKAHETESAGRWLRHLCQPSTRIAVLQNGIDHAARVAPFIGGATVVPAIVYYNGERLAADHVRMRHVTDYDLAVPDDVSGRAFAQLLQGTPFRVLLAGDFTTLMWRKLLINAVANPMTALTRQRQVVLRREDIHALCVAVLDEAVMVGRADGADLADDETQQTLATLLTYPPEVGTSMYFDCLAGRPLEIDALTGAIVTAGERHGIATPLNRALLTLLRAISDAAK